MGKTIKCHKCGAGFERPMFGYKPWEYKHGIKTMGGIAKLGAIFTCPECNFEGTVDEFETIS